MGPTPASPNERGGPGQNTTARPLLEPAPHPFPRPRPIRLRVWGSGPSRPEIEGQIPVGGETSVLPAQETASGRIGPDESRERYVLIRALVYQTLQIRGILGG